MPTLPRITRVNLAGVRGDSPAMPQLIEALAMRCVNLKVLHLGYAKMNERAILAFGAALMKGQLSHLKELYLEGGAAPGLMTQLASVVVMGLRAGFLDSLEEPSLRDREGVSDPVLMELATAIIEWPGLSLFRVDLGDRGNEKWNGAKGLASQQGHH